MPPQVETLANRETSNVRIQDKGRANYSILKEASIREAYVDVFSCPVTGQSDIGVLEITHYSTCWSNGRGGDGVKCACTDRSGGNVETNIVYGRDGAKELVVNL